MNRPPFLVAVRELRHSQKPGAGVPVYTRYVNRPVGRLIAAAAANIGATPNQVTLVSGVLTLAGFAVLVLVPATPAPVFAAVALLVAGYAFDSADGQLARLQGSGSAVGEWLDHVVDAARNPAAHLVVLVALYRWSDVEVGYLWVPMMFAVLVSTKFFALILAEQLRQAGPPTGDESRGAQRMRSVMQLPSDTGVQNLVLLTLPWASVFMVVYGVLFALNAVLAAASLVRKYREMTRLVR